MTAFIPYIVLMLILLFGSLWVAAALGLTGAVAIFISTDLKRLFLIVGTQFWNVNTTFTIIALPLFIFMGEIMSRSGIIDLIYKRVSIIAYGLPGGLLHSNIFACSIFAACSGSSMASAAAIGSIGYPLQKEQKYDNVLSLGSIAAGGTLGILIPPSIPMIIYAVLSEESLGKIYLGGVIPGIILSVLFTFYILIRSIKTTEHVSAPIEKVNLRQRLKAVVDLWEIILLVVIILGGIYGGIATPTEVAAIGATAAIILGSFFNQLTWEKFNAGVIATVITTAMIMLVVFGAQLLSTALFYYNVAPYLSRLVSGADVSAAMILFYVTVLYIVLGMFFDGISMMVITIPFIAPILKTVGVDLIWFGVYMAILIEMGLLTPPVGLNLYVLQGVTREPISLIIKGSAPFLIPMALLLVLLVLFPQLAMWLPSLMN